MRDRYDVASVRAQIICAVLLVLLGAMTLVAQVRIYRERCAAESADADEVCTIDGRPVDCEATDR